MLFTKKKVSQMFIKKETSTFHTSEGHVYFLQKKEAASFKELDREWIVDRYIVKRRLSD